MGRCRDVIHVRVAVARCALVAAAAVAAIPAMARGQGPREADSPRLRADCRLAAHVLQSGHPAPRSDWALGQMTYCDETAGPTLAALWAAPQGDSLALEQLYASSAAVRDARILAAPAATARATGAPTAARLTALRVLAAYADPHVVVALAHITPTADSGIRVTRSHAPQITGAQPITPASIVEVKALVESLAASDPSPAARFACRTLRVLVFRNYQGQPPP